MTDDQQPDDEKVSFISIVFSTICAWFGVQTKKNRERDFKHGKAEHFIIAGIMLAILFVFMVVGIVQIVMSTVGVS